MKQLLTRSILLLAFSVAAVGQTTEFTYQGRLLLNGVAANANHDFEFRLCASESDCATPLQTKQRLAVAVANGTFTVNLDFQPAHFNGAERWLEIAVRPVGGPTFTVLGPRQKITASPYSIHSLKSESAATAANSIQLGGVPSNQYVITTDPRMTDARLPTAGSGDYIQNGTSQQAVSNFSISGNGSVGGTLNAAALNANTLAVSGGGTFGGAMGVGTTLSVTGPSFFNSIFAGNGSFLGALNVTGNGTFGGSGTFSGAMNIGASLAVNGSSTFSGDGTFSGVISAGGNGTFGGNGAFTGSGFFGGNLGVGTGSPSAKLHVAGNGLFTGNVVFPNGGTFSGVSTEGATGLMNFGINSGREGVYNSALPGFWMRTDVRESSRGFYFFSRGGDVETQLMSLTEDATLRLGTETGGVPGNLIVYGDSLLNTLTIANGLKVNVLGSAGVTTICRNALAQISSCSSSLRYKTNVNPFPSGLELVKRLRPVTFNWKAGDIKDLGLIAEEVAGIEPLLATYNDKGEVEGIKYERIGVVLINAVKEQQKQIDAQQRQIEALMRIVCEIKPNAAECEEQGK